MLKTSFCDYSDGCILVKGSSSPDIFLGKYVLKICSKVTGEHPCRSLMSIM